MDARKLRLRALADGRFGFPGVVEYVITAGPDTGEVLLAPPAIEAHEDPGTGSTWPFMLIVRDQLRYERLCRAGWIYDPRHTGRRRGPVIDNRSAPGT